MKTELYQAALLLIAGTRALATVKTDFDNDSGLLKINCFIGDGNTTATPGGADPTTDSGALQTGLADDATLAKGKIVGDNDSNLQQDQSNDSGQQQGNPDDNAGGERQQDQSNDAGQQANNTATETAEVKDDTGGGERQPE